MRARSRLALTASLAATMSGAVVLCAPGAQAATTPITVTCRFAGGTTAFQFSEPVTVTLSPTAPKPNKPVTATITYTNGFKNGPVALPAGNLYAESTLKINVSTTKMKMTHVTQGNPTEQPYALPPAKVSFIAKSGTNTIVLTQIVHWHSVFGVSASTKCVPPGGAATIASFNASATALAPAATPAPKPTPTPIPIPTPTPTPTPTAALTTPTPTPTTSAGQGFFPPPTSSSTPSQSDALGVPGSTSSGNTAALLLVGGIAAIAAIAGGATAALNARQSNTHVRPNQANGRPR